MTLVDRELPMQAAKMSYPPGKCKEGALVDPVRCRVNTAQPPLSFHAAQLRAVANAEQSRDCVDVGFYSSEEEEKGRAAGTLEVEHTVDNVAYFPGANVGDETISEMNKPTTSWSCSMCSHVNHLRRKNCSQCGFSVFFTPTYPSSRSPRATTVRHVSDSIMDSHKWRASVGFGSENPDQVMSILAAESERVMRLSSRRTHGRVDKLLAAEASSLLQNRQPARLHSSLSALRVDRADSSDAQAELTHVLPPVLRRYSSHDHVLAEAARPLHEPSARDSTSGHLRRRSCEERRGLHDEVREFRAPRGHRLSLEHDPAPADVSGGADAPDQGLASPQCLTPLAPAHLMRWRHMSASAPGAEQLRGVDALRAVDSLKGMDQSRGVDPSRGIDPVRGRTLARLASPPRCLGPAVASCVADSISCMHTLNPSVSLLSVSHHHRVGGGGGVDAPGGESGDANGAHSIAQNHGPISGHSSSYNNNTHGVGECAGPQQGSQSYGGVAFGGPLMSWHQRAHLDAALEQHLLLGPSTASLLENGREAALTACELALCGRTPQDNEARRECLSALPRPEECAPPPRSKLRMKLLRRWSLHVESPGRGEVGAGEAMGRSGGGGEGGMGTGLCARSGVPDGLLKGFINRRQSKH